MDRPDPGLTSVPGTTPGAAPDRGARRAGPGGPGDGNAPDEIAGAVEVFVRTHLDGTRPLLVACSGGADSLALAAAVACIWPAGRIAAATVDHQMQAESAAVAHRTAQVLRGLGYVDPAVLTVRVDRAGGPEAAARRARYVALADHARILAADAAMEPAILLGHTLDDQAETVLLGLGRGSGPRSVAGMRPWQPPWGRPLLTIRRMQTESACRAFNLEPWADPQNRDPAFTRARLRHEVLPLLDEVLAGGTVPALARTAMLMADDLAALDEIAAAALERVLDADNTLDGSALAVLPRAIRRRVLRSWIDQSGGGPLTFDHLSRLDRLVSDPHGPAQVRIPGSLDVWRSGPRVRLVPLD
jgi:tRNA(Ile)-lysidine synthase